MAGKKSSGKTYVSKGIHSNVNQKTLNAMRKARGFDVKAWEARAAHRDFVITRNDPKTAHLRTRYEKEDAVELQAWLFFEQYRDAGINWGACVHAAKTNWASQLHEKWGPRLKAIREKNSANMPTMEERQQMVDRAKKKSKKR
jgi:hypothetical protein